MGMGSVYGVVQRFSLANLFDKRRADSKKGEKS